MNPGRPLSDAERRDWVRLARTQNVGPVTFAQLLKRFGSPAAALGALPEIARRAGRRRPIVAPVIDEIDAEIEATQRYGARIVASCEADFPTLLRTLAPPPPILTLLGRAPLAAQPTVAIVGARNASAAGRKLARDIAAGVGDAGFVTVSGLALGIDGEAHAATLRTGTIAVLGGAVDHI
jgi:DNA processing protein